MNSIDLPGRYAKVRISEESYGTKNDEICRYATIEFSHTDRPDDRLKVAFSLTMDTWVRDEARRVFGQLLPGYIPQKEIYLEDTWLMVNWPDESSKRYQMLLVDVLRRAEDMYDMLRNGKDPEKQSWWARFLAFFRNLL